MKSCFKRYSIYDEIKQYRFANDCAVVVTDRLNIIIIYNAGFNSDHVVVYDYDKIKYGLDNTYNKTITNLVEKAIRFVRKHPDFEKYHG